MPNAPQNYREPKRLWRLPLLLAVVVLALMLPLIALRVEPAAAETRSLINSIQKSTEDTTREMGMYKGAVNDPRVVIARMVRNLMNVLGILFVVLTIYAGYLYMTAGGNEEQVSKAKKLLTNAIIGLIIILSAWSIASFVITSIYYKEAKKQTTTFTDSGEVGIGWWNSFVDSFMSPNTTD